MIEAITIDARTQIKITICMKTQNRGIHTV